MNSRIFTAVFSALVIAGGLLAPNTAQAAVSAAGTNISYNKTIYYVAPNGQKRLYPSESIFLSYKNNSLAAVQPATSEDIALPTGSPMVPREGMVVCSTRLNDIGTCYLITGGKKAPFASVQVIKDLGYDLSKALQEDISYLDYATPITSSTDAHRFGTVINKDGTVYYAGINGLMAFSNPETLFSWGYDFTDVLPANSADNQRSVKFLVEPKVTGETWPFEPVLPVELNLSNEDKFIVPFAGKTLPITEGWLYSNEERSIHGYVQHGAIDFAYNRGTPIYASADGYAVSSTHLVPLARTYQDKQVGFGLGEFVQIWHPKQGVYTSYSHLQRVADNIPYFKPKCDDTGFCDPEIIYNSTDYIKRKGVEVKQGDLIGWMGDSGLSWGYTEEPREERDLKENKSWDEVHLHFEIYTRNDETFFKAKRYDPFGIFGRLGQYSDSAYFGPDSLWKLDSENKPVLAK